MRYEKGRKEASRDRIIEVATQRFRTDGIAASGLAGIMAEAGLTNGAFYPHFPSKTALVRDCVSKALETQADQLREAVKTGGLEAVIDLYLSAAHRDNPGKGCASAALLPELARAPSDTRQAYTEDLQALARNLSAELPPRCPGPGGRDVRHLRHAGRHAAAGPCSGRAGPVGPHPGGRETGSAQAGAALSTVSAKPPARPW